RPLAGVGGALHRSRPAARGKQAMTGFTGDFRMRRIHKSRAALIVVLMLAGCAANPIPGESADRGDVGAAKRQVADTERAFARTMATRDHKAFSSFLSQEA